MDENQENQTQNQSQETTSATSPFSEPKTPDVGFPQAQPKPKPKANLLIFVAILVILAIAAAIFFFVRGKSEEGKASPTPTSFARETPEPTETPEALDRSKVKIEAQNGTGIPGEAKFLQDKLKEMGYTNVNVGNAGSQDYSTTVVTFAKNANSTVVKEITDKLEEIYKSVQSKTSSTLSTDALIITGLRKGQTPKPSATASPTPKATSTASPTATPTSTATPTATP